MATASSKIKVNWSDVKAAYQRGEGSCRELAERFGVTVKAIENRCTREKWRVEKKEIEGKVREKVILEASNAVVDWYKKAVAGLSRDFAAIENTLEQGADLLEPQDVRHLVLARKAVIESFCDLGIIDRVKQKIEHSGSLTITDEQKSELKSLYESVAKRSGGLCR